MTHTIEWVVHLDAFGEELVRTSDLPLNVSLHHSLKSITSGIDVNVNTTVVQGYDAEV